MQETWVQPLGWEDPLEEGMATHSSILAWRIPMYREAWLSTVQSELTEQLGTHTELFYHHHKQGTELSLLSPNHGLPFCSQILPTPCPSHHQPVSLSLWFCLFQRLRNAVL